MVSTKDTAPLGTLLQLDTIPSATCMVVNQLQPLLPKSTIQVMVPAGTDPSTLPSLAPATVLAATAGTPTGCP